MKVAFVASGYENLGVEYLSACLKRQGHQVRLFFDPQTFGGGVFLKIDFLNRILSMTEKVVSAVVEWDPDIIGFSCMAHNYQWSLDVARRIKKARPSTAIIFGGIQPTSIPEHVLSHDCVDMVAVGEGEFSLLRLIESMEQGNGRTDIRGIYFKKGKQIISNPVQPLCVDLDSLPFPDKDAFFEKIPAFGKISYSITASRGCPFSCTYCCNDFLRTLYKGDQFSRRRTVQNLIAELREAKRKYNISSVFFYDEVFPGQLSWLQEFSETYRREIRLPFKIYYHFRLADEERIKLLKNAGCGLIAFGLESVSERIRRQICNRIYTNEEVISAIRMCQEYEIETVVDHLFGLPTETEADQKEAVRFYRMLSPDIVYSFWLVYYPKTSIIEKAISADLLSEEDLEHIDSGERSYFHNSIFVKNKKVLEKYETLLDLVPLVSAKKHEIISETPLIFKLLPHGYFTHHFLLFLANLRMEHSPDTDHLKLLFSRKHVP